MAESHEPGAGDHLERPIITEREKPALDEETFQQLLEAAHVLQAQKTFEVVSRPRPDPTEALAEIVETQEFLRSQPSDLQAAANVVVERLQKITHATGVAVAVVRENRLEYCAATGDAAGLTGTSLPMDSSLSADGKLSTEFSRAHEDKHSIALPLNHEGSITGLLEIRFADAASVEAPEMRSCQLMAGLMTEAIAREADKEWRQTLAAERAAMLEALERIKPQLERLAVGPATSIAEPAKERVESREHVVEPVETDAVRRVALPVSQASAKSGRDTVCPQCGYQFGEHELFCGRCGNARPEKPLASRDSQSKWASRSYLVEATRREEEEQENSGGSKINSPAISDAPVSVNLRQESFPGLRKQLAHLSGESGASELAPERGSEVSGETGEDPTPALALQEPAKLASPWGSAASAHKWLESLNAKSAAGIWLAKHRADLYVGAAVLLLLVVLSGWGLRPSETHVPSKHSPQPNLSLFEKMLVNLGLAEAPPTPVYLGNPNARVWVDLHTALYYCSGSDLYGKTPGGKFTTQRDAQLDQFEPAARKNCD
jgi:hypothetical protein